MMRTRETGKELSDGSLTLPLGAMYENAETPDGYRAGPDGARVR